MDQDASEATRAQVRQLAAEVEGVAAIEKLRLRKAGLEFFAEVHVQVDPGISVAEGHAIGGRVRTQLLAAFPLVRDVFIHLEPYEPQPPAVQHPATPAPDPAAESPAR